MNFNEFIEIDLTSNALYIKFYHNKITTILKLNNKEIKEIKLKKDTILFFTITKNYENPIKPEVTFNIYLLQNHLLELIFESEDKKELENLEEFVKSILI